MANLLDPKVIQTAKEKLKLGKSKQETFEELSAEFQIEPETLAKTIRFIPTKEKRNKYYPLTILISILLMSLFFIEAYFIKTNNKEMSYQFIISTIVAVFLVMGMLRANPVFFSGSAIYAAIRIIFALINLSDGTTFEGILKFEMILCPLIISLGFYLRVKLDSKYTIDENRTVKFQD